MNEAPNTINLEKDLNQLKTDVGTTKSLLKGTLPHLATRVDVERDRGCVGVIKPELERFATKKDLERLRSDVEAIKTQLETLIAKADMTLLQSDIRAVKAQLNAGFQQFATQANMQNIHAEIETGGIHVRDDIENVRFELKHRCRRIMLGSIGTVLATAVAVFAIVRFLGT